MIPLVGFVVVCHEAIFMEIIFYHGKQDKNMQVKIEDKSSVEKTLFFEVEADVVTKELDNAYADLKKKADIKGFRKGKIPRKVLESRFGASVCSEVASKLIQDSFEKALKEHELKVVGGPKIDPPELVPGNPFVFDITIDVKPEIGDVDYEGIDLKKPMYCVEESDIDTQIHILQKSLATKEIVSDGRAVTEDDYVCIDYQGYLDGKPYEHTPLRENYVMGIGRGLLPAEISEKLLGLAPVQTVEVPVDYDADHHDENLKGKSIVYHVTLKEIQEEVLPPLDDELAKKSGTFQTLDEMKSAIRENLERNCNQRMQNELNNQIFVHLLEKYAFEVPQTMVEAELGAIIAETEQMCMQNNISLEDMGFTKESLKEKYRGVAEKQARRHVILDQIIVQEELDLSKEEMEEGLERMAKEMNLGVDAVKNYFSMAPQQLDYYIHGELENKAMELIISKANVTEVSPEEMEADKIAEAASAQMESVDKAQESGKEEEDGEKEE